MPRDVTIFLLHQVPLEDAMRALLPLRSRLAGAPRADSRWSIEVERADEALVSAALRQMGERVHSVQRRRWTLRERRAAPWGLLRFRRTSDASLRPAPMEAIDRTSACPECLVGARAPDGYVFQPKGRRLSDGCYVHLMAHCVSTRVKEALLAALPKLGVNFTPVRMPEESGPPPYWLFDPVGVAGPMDPTSDWQASDWKSYVGPCAICGSAVMFPIGRLAGVVRYRRKCLPAEGPFLRTRELAAQAIHFEEGVILPRHYLLASQAGFRALGEALGMRRIEFEPIEVVE